MSTEAKIWKEGEAYKKGETVFYEGFQYVANRRVTIAVTPPNKSKLWTYIEPNWEVVTNSTVEKQLLIQVCKAFDELESGEGYTTLTNLNIHGLVHWWEHNKPKTKEELLEERIVGILENVLESYKRDIKVNTNVVAKNLLKLLGE